jgi:hypothetical protein
MYELIKTGEVFDLNEDGLLVLCESWLNKQTQETTTTQTVVETNVSL